MDVWMKTEVRNKSLFIVSDEGLDMSLVREHTRKKNCLNLGIARKGGGTMQQQA